METEIAYHEAGHLLLCTLVRKLNLSAKIEIEVQFPKPTAISINNKTNGGELRGSGFLMENWTKVNLARISNFEATRRLFYKSHREFALGNALILIGGHTIDCIFNYPEKLEYNSFGNKKGEDIDVEQFDRVANFLINSTNRSRLSEEYIHKRNQLINSLRDDIHDLVKSDSNVKKAIDLIVNRITQSDQKVNGDKIIEETDFNDLLIEIEEILKNVSIEFIFEKHFP